MAIRLDEGETLPIPCRNCASLSIEVVICVSSTLRRCERCKVVNRVMIQRIDDGWAVSTELTDDVSTPDDRA